MTIWTIIRYQYQRIAKLLQQAPALSKHDAALKHDITKCQSPAKQADILSQYFWRHHQHYLSRTKLRAYYPGLASMHGSASDGLEGVSRLLPLWAVYVQTHMQSSGEDNLLVNDMQNQLTHCIVKGTDPSYRFNWGQAEDFSQLICEAADIALAIWLSRTQVFDKLNASQQKQVITWLCSFLDKQVADNNWHLFIAQIDAVVCSLCPTLRYQSSQRLTRVHSFYVSDGAFRDGNEGEVDFYNAWGFHYAIYWIDKICPSPESALLKTALFEFVPWYSHLFTRQGFPLYGRSLCYRYAAAAPLLAAACSPNSPISKETAISINFHVWQYLSAQGGISKGRPNQGVFGDNARLLDSYSGPSSAFWGTRSLVMFYHLQQQGQFQDLVSTHLPSDNKAQIDLPKLGMRIETQMDSGCVILRKTVQCGGDHEASTTTDKNTVAKSALGECNGYYDNVLKNKLREILYGFAFRGKPQGVAKNARVSSDLLAQYNNSNSKTDLNEEM